MKHKHLLEPYLRPDVYAPGEPLPEPGAKEPFFAKGGLIMLACLLLIIIFKVWLAGEFRQLIYYFFPR